MWKTAQRNVGKSLRLFLLLIREKLAEITVCVSVGNTGKVIKTGSTQPLFTKKFKYVSKWFLAMVPGKVLDPSLRTIY